MSQFKMTKFYYDNPAEAVELQRAMFKLGFMWNHKERGDKREPYAGIPQRGYIYVDQDCRMFFSSREYGLTDRKYKSILNRTVLRAALDFAETKKAERKASRKRASQRRAGWTVWNGGEMPVKQGTVVDVQWRNGTVVEGIVAGECGGAGVRFWLNEDMTCDIVSYRVVPPVAAEAPYIPWAGGVMPVPKGTVVDVKYRRTRDGKATMDGLVAGVDSGATEPYWRDDNMGNDIVGYRIVSTGDLTVSGTLTMTNPVIVTPKIDPALDPMANPKHAIGNTALPMTMPSPLFRAMVALGKANGAGKYGGANYIGTPVVMSTYLNAIQRHLDKIIMGEEADEIDGVPHWGAIGANIDIIVSAQAAGTLIDDRLRADGQLAAVKALTPLVASLTALHKDRTPKHFYMKDKA